LQYIIAPVYIFNTPKSFKGNYILNPYLLEDSGNWYVANFHVHSNYWNFTQTKGSSADLIKNYKIMNYNVIAISDYMHINKKNENIENILYIPAYEHGYGIYKNHHLIINAKNVNYFDYLFKQNIHFKQYMIEVLKDDSNLIVINHPRLRNGFTSEEIKYLKGYDLLEVFNHNWFSEHLWDSALSNGNLIYAIANDDGHDINNPKDIGRCFNFIYSKNLSTYSIVESLKKGNAFFVNLSMNDNETFADKGQHISRLPLPKSIKINDDTLFIKFNDNNKINIVKFIGQNGHVKKILTNPSNIYYKITSEDTYIRTIIELKDGTLYYFNPVIRYTNFHKLFTHPSKNTLLTICQKILSIIILILLTIIYLRIIKQLPKENQL